MNPELVSAIVSGALVIWGAYAAIQATRSKSRMTMLGGLTTALAFLLLVRLVAGFGGWSDGFVYIWLAAMAAYAVAAFRAALVWPDLPWRAEDAKTRSTEVPGVAISAGMALLVAAALVLPGLMLG